MSTKNVNAYFHSTKSTRWETYLKEIYYDSYGCLRRNLSTDLIIERNGRQMFSE